MHTTRILVAALLLQLSLNAAAQAPAGQAIPVQAPAGQPPAGAGAQPAGPRASRPLPENAPAVDIFALIDRLADEMDKEFIIDPRLGGTGFFSTAGGEADYNTLQAVLRANGFATIEVGDEIRIVPEATARSEPSLVLNEDDSRVSDHAVVTRVIDIADLDSSAEDGAAGSAAAQLVPVLRPLMSTQIGQIVFVSGTNKLILVDRYDNVRRITAIIDAMRR
jgi:general secretion pathway protein D